MGSASAAGPSEGECLRPHTTSLHAADSRVRERPATDRVDPPGRDQDDEATSNQNQQSRVIGRWGEEYAFFALEAELAARFVRDGQRDPIRVRAAIDDGIRNRGLAL